MKQELIQFAASNKPFPEWWNSDGYILATEEANEELEYLKSMDIKIFAVQNEDIIPILQADDHLRLWDFKYIVRL